MMVWIWERYIDVTDEGWSTATVLAVTCVILFPFIGYVFLIAYYTCFHRSRSDIMNMFYDDETGNLRRPTRSHLKEFDLPECCFNCIKCCFVDDEASSDQSHQNKAFDGHEAHDGDASHA